MWCSWTLSGAQCSEYLTPFVCQIIFLFECIIKMHKTKRASRNGFKRRSLKRKQRGGKTRKLDDSSVVAGDIRKGKVNGVGTRTYANGSVYEGLFDGFIPHGMGKITNPDGSTLEGEFREGTLIEGLLHMANGEIYEGQLRGHLGNGRGTYTWPSGTFYVGEFENGKLHGHGVMTLDNGFVMDGEFRDGLVNGHGRLTSPDGSFEEGLFRTIKGEIVNLDMPPLELSSPPWDPKLVKRAAVERRIAEMPSW